MTTNTDGSRRTPQNRVHPRGETFMSNELTDRRVAFLTAMEGVEKAELTSP